MTCIGDHGLSHMQVFRGMAVVGGWLAVYVVAVIASARVVSSRPRWGGLFWHLLAVGATGALIAASAAVPPCAAVSRALLLGASLIIMILWGIYNAASSVAWRRAAARLHLTMSVALMSLLPLLFSLLPQSTSLSFCAVGVAVALFGVARACRPLESVHWSMVRALGGGLIVYGAWVAPQSALALIGLLITLLSSLAINREEKR